MRGVIEHKRTTGTSSLEAKGSYMALKTRGKLIALGLVTFASAAALAAGGVALADDHSQQQQPVLRITTNDNSGTQLQNVQQSPDSRDCPFGHDRAPAGSGTDNAGGDV
jgi:hypothetical protein